MIESPVPNPARGTARQLRRAGWVAMTFLATLLALFSARYFTLNPHLLPPVYVAHLGALLLHVGGGVVALALGPWQFVGRLRARRPGLHRLIGRVYLVAIVVAGVGGLLLAPVSQGGPLAHLGFATLAVVLIGTSALAYVSIRRRRIAEHRAWMTRSYALIFTAVTFRVWLIALAIAGLPPEQVNAVGAWSTWLINLVVADLLLARAARDAGVVRAPARATIER